MKLIKIIYLKIIDLFSFIAKRITNGWFFYKRSPLNYFVSIASWLAWLEIIILLGWLVIQVDRITGKEIVTESFEAGNVRVNVRLPKYVGEGENGKLSVSVENFGKDPLETIRIYISDDTGEYIWFPDGNGIEFKSLKQDEQKYGEIFYVVNSSIPKNITSFRFSVVADYSFLVDEKDKTQESQPMPLIRAQFLAAPEIQVDAFKGGFISLSNGFEEGTQGLSNFKDLVGFLVAILAGIVALRGNFLDIFGRKKL